MPESARILVADDEDALRELLRETLTTFGYAFDEARDGVEAVEKLRKQSFDLVLLDINMPRMSGLDVLRTIRAENLHTRVIMLTGRVGFTVGTESMSLGANEYITKPFDLDYLQFSIERVLSEPVR